VADWVDNYYEIAQFDTEGVSMGCRVKLPQPIRKTASDCLHVSYKVNMVDGGTLGLEMHMDENKDDG
jgi:hypothetical protein